MDVLVGYSKELDYTVRQLIGARSKDVLLKMQKSVLSQSPHSTIFQAHDINDSDVPYTIAYYMLFFG